MSSNTELISSPTAAMPALTPVKQEPVSKLSLIHVVQPRHVKVNNAWTDPPRLDATPAITSALEMMKQSQTHPKLGWSTLASLSTATSPSTSTTGGCDEGNAASYAEDDMFSWTDADYMRDSDLPLSAYIEPDSLRESKNPDGLSDMQLLPSLNHPLGYEGLMDFDTCSFMKWGPLVIHSSCFFLFRIFNSKLN